MCVAPDILGHKQDAQPSALLRPLLVLELFLRQGKTHGFICMQPLPAGYVQPEASTALGIRSEQRPNAQSNVLL